jgi:hypothetical protein
MKIPASRPNLDTQYAGHVCNQALVLFLNLSSLLEETGNTSLTLLSRRFSLRATRQFRSRCLELLGLRLIFREGFPYGLFFGNWTY